jgi:hypothetical protein
MTRPTPTPPPHPWKFFRSGGLDQVLLESGADLRALSGLDQKLWVALSCPVKGLELDEQTLALIDADADGHIRVPELLAAVAWADARLVDLGSLLQGSAALPLSAIAAETPAGRILVASARQILASTGHPEATAITVAQAADTATIFAASPLNGAGVIPPEATADPALQTLIQEIVACVGGTPDRNGSAGVTAAQIAHFFAELAAYAEWVGQSAAREIAILGDATDAAVGALRAVRAKVDDYFARCRLAAFDARSTSALNREEADYSSIAARELTRTGTEVTAFPLAHIEAGRPLPLGEGLNPAWAEAIATLEAKAIAPRLGPGRTELTEAEWLALNAAFAPYETWLGGKAGSAVEKLGLARVRELLAGPGRSALAALVAKDQELAPEFQAISDVERLARYHRDLRDLLHNFVNFADFYSQSRWAVFQAGTLYLDGRSARLCLRVDAPNPLAAMSKACIAYCSCTRSGGQTMTVAACITQGDSDYLLAGRHGVFYDRQGRDWDAVITSVVDNPISVREAVFAPYKKFVRLIEDLVAKRAAAAGAASDAKMAAAATTAATADQAITPVVPTPPAKPAAKPIDVGTVAALGVAFGAIGSFGTTLAVYATHVVHGGIWMMLGAVLGVLAVISGPSVLIAWLKLRQRTLGPILDANGWAINGRVKINVPFGEALTDLARLPPGSRRLPGDPYADRRAAARRRLLLAFAVLVALAALAWNLRHHGQYQALLQSVGLR